MRTQDLRTYNENVDKSPFAMEQEEQNDSI